MLREFFNDMLTLLPSFRSFIGDSRANGLFENTASVQFQKQWKELVKKYSILLDEPKDRIDLDTLTTRWIIKNETDLLKYPDVWMYITSYENPILGFIVDDQYTYPLKTQHDVSNLVSRTKARIPFIEDVMLEMKKGLARGRTIPQRICKKLILQLRHVIKTRQYCSTIPKNLDNTEYVEVIDKEYLPVLYKLLDFLRGFYKSCRKSIGLCYVSDGKDMYKAIVKSSTTLDITPEEVHAYGIEETKRLYKELEAFRNDLVHELGLPKKEISNRQLFQAIKSKEGEYYKNANDILRAYREAQEKIRQTIIPKYFGKNVAKYRVIKMPKLIQNSSSSVYYYPPSIKSKRRGAVFVNIGDTHLSPKYTIDLLSLHEGAPGHHYQYQYMKEHNMPIYRIHAGDNDAYTEGWALYCESFANVSNPKILFGRWIYSMLRAARLVVDTGINYYGWSYKRALAYMVKNVPLDVNDLYMELERYICDPGQAISYKIGERFFIEERDKFVKMGHGTIKDFHNEVLECGPMPLGVLRQKLEHHITCVTKK